MGEISHQPNIRRLYMVMDVRNTSTVREAESHYTIHTHEHECSQHRGMEYDHMIYIVGNSSVIEHRCMICCQLLYINATKSISWD